MNCKELESTLNDIAREAEPPRLPRAVPASAAAHAQALPPAPARVSITEGTTELLAAPDRISHRDTEPQRVRQKGREVD